MNKLVYGNNKTVITLESSQRVQIFAIFASRGFSAAAPLCGTHSHPVFVTLPLPILSSRLSAHPSGSPKCLRFGHWLSMRTLNIPLLTYLLKTVMLPAWFQAYVSVVQGETRRS